MSRRQRSAGLPRDGRRGEAGVATVLVLGLLAVPVTATVLAVGVARVVTARHLAGAAADLGALAGAGAAVRGDDGCAAAAEVVREGGAELVDCRVEGSEVVVRATVRTEPLLGLRWAPGSSARAGPVP